VSAAPVGVLVMAHGTPDDPGQIEEFYTAIRRGRPPTPELLAELTGRYEAIGGLSPLTARTWAQVRALAAALDEARPGAFAVRLGTKYADPAIGPAVDRLAAEGVRRIVGLVLTPHRSSMGSGEYHRRAVDAVEAGGTGIAYTPVHGWHDAPGFAALLAHRLDAVLAEALADGGPVALFFTAHSLPTRVVADGDPYPDEVRASAEAVVAASALAGRTTWSVAWQSAGRTADPWIGPDLLEEIRRVAADGAARVVVCPVGFVSDHLEVLYDIDIEALAVARSCGIALTQTPSLNDDPAFVTVLAGVVEAAADS